MAGLYHHPKILGASRVVSEEPIIEPRAGDIHCRRAGEWFPADCPL